MYIASYLSESQITQNPSKYMQFILSKSKIDKYISYKYHMLTYLLVHIKQYHGFCVIHCTVAIYGVKGIALERAMKEIASSMLRVTFFLNQDLHSKLPLLCHGNDTLPCYALGWIICDYAILSDSQRTIITAL